MIIDAHQHTFWGDRDDASHNEGGVVRATRLAASEAANVATAAQ